MPIGATRIETDIKSTTNLEKYLDTIGRNVAGFHNDSLGYDDVYHIGYSTVLMTSYHGLKLQIEVVGRYHKTLAQKIAKWIKRHEKPTVLDLHHERG
ncbi:MAG: hypothetical protein J4452_02425 [Candidatus Aenigmarchaeota archaeon]|nr:hypothetical protein [Candidatus Aenigmarchaeota archaeon]